MGEPKRKDKPARKPKAVSKPKLGPHPLDRELFEDPSGNEILDVDGEAHVRCLLTGEGKLWPERSS